MVLRGLISRLGRRSGTSGNFASTRPDSLSPAPVTQRYSAGEVIAQRYRIDRYISYGGMGEVYAATDTILQSSVALKFPRVYLSGDPKAEARFRREVKLAQQIQHKGICRMHNLDVHDGDVFCVMELLRGETLADRLEREGPLPIAEAITVTRELCQALDAAHANGVVHRDLKPGNIFLLDGRVVITDFGLARIASATHSLTPEGAVIGTLAYMAPEQVERGLETHHVDIYSLGAVMYEMVTGLMPHGNGQPLSLLVRKLREDHTRPRDLRRDIPLVMEECIQRCLAMRSESRPKSGAEILSSLDRGRPSLRYQLTRQSRWVELSLAFVALLLLLAFGVSRLAPRADMPDEALLLIQRGQLALSESSPVRAGRLLERAVQRFPDVLDAHSHLAIAYSQMDQADKAKDEILNATALADKRWFVSRGERMALAAARSAVARDYLAAAGSFAQLAALRSDASRRFAQLYQGLMLEAGQKSDEANGVFSAIVEENAASAEASAAARMQLALLSARRGQHEEAARHVSLARAAYEKSGSVEGLTELLLNRNQFERNLSPAEDLAGLQRAIDLSATTGNKLHEVAARYRRASILVSQRDFEAGLVEARLAADLARREGLLTQTARALSDLAYNLMIVRHYAEAEPLLREAMQISERSRSYATLARSRMFLGELLGGTARCEEAVEVMRPAVEWHRANGTVESLPMTLIKWGTVLVNNPRASIDAFEEALTLARGNNQVLHEAMALQRLGAFHAMRDPHKALRYYDQAIAGSRKSAKPMQTAQYLMVSVANLTNLGETAQAEERLREAEAILLSYSDGPDRKRYLAGIGDARADLAMVAGNWESAELQLRKTVDITREPTPQDKSRRLLVRGMRGNPEIALGLLRRETDDQPQNAFWPGLRWHTAMMALRASRWMEARDIAASARQAALRAEAPFQSLLHALVLRKAYHALGEQARVKELSAECIELARALQLDAPFWRRTDVQQLWNLQGAI